MAKEATKAVIPIWEKAALSTEETAAYMDVHADLVRALALASKHGMNDFPAFWVGTSIKVARLPLLKWLADTAMSHRDLKRAATMDENAKQVDMKRKRGRPRKQIFEGRYEVNA